MDNQPHGRRHILGALLGLPLVAVLPTPAAATHPDRELIDLVEATMAAGDELRTLSVREMWDDITINAACDYWRDLHRRAVALPATTREGRAAKARLIIDDRRGDQDGYVPEHDALASLLHDLVTGAGA